MFAAKPVIFTTTLIVVLISASSTAIAQDGSRYSTYSQQYQAPEFNDNYHSGYKDQEQKQSTGASPGAWLGLAAAAGFLLWLASGEEETSSAPRSEYRPRYYTAPSSGYSGNQQSAPAINSFYSDCHGGSFYGC